MGRLLTSQVLKNNCRLLAPPKARPIMDFGRTAKGWMRVYMARRVGAGIFNGFERRLGQ